MINVECTSRYMNAYGGLATNGGPTGPYVGGNSNNPVQGMLRYQDGSMQVFDGAGWSRIVMDISVGLDAEGEQVLDWARERMAQERKWAALAEHHPAVADAVKARDRAEQALTIVSRLCGELET